MKSDTLTPTEYDSMMQEMEESMKWAKIQLSQSGYNSTMQDEKESFECMKQNDRKEK